MRTAAPSSPVTPPPNPATLLLSRGGGGARAGAGELAALSALDKPFLKTSGKLKISQLRKYLSKKLRVDDASELELLCAGEGLAAEHSLHFIKRTLWPQPGVELVIHYRKNPNLKY